MATVAASRAQGGGRGSHDHIVNKLQNIAKELEHGKERKRVPWIHTSRADTLFGLVILLNAIFLGFDIEFGEEEGTLWPFFCIESAFLLTFCVEIGLRIRAAMPRMLSFFDAWGSFDFLVTFLGVADAWIITPALGFYSDNPLGSFTVLRMVRLVRLVRLIRVLRMFSELVILVQTIGNSLRNVAWMSLLLLLIMYSGSIVTVVLIGVPHRQSDEDVDKYFGSIASALFTHFCVVTLEGWPDIANSAMRYNRLWAVYFVCMIILTNFALVNLMVGVIVERIIHHSLEQENELSSFVAESEAFRSTLQLLFNSADIDFSGEVSKYELRTLMDLQQTKDVLNAFGININIPQEMLITIMGLTGDGPATFEEFFDSCMRLCGSKQSIHSVFVQHDICGCQQELSRRLADLQSHLEQLQTAEASFAAEVASNEDVRPPLAIAPQKQRCSPSADGAGAASQAGVSELLDRLDRFGLVQQQICAELHALQTHVQRQHASEPGEHQPAAGDGWTAGVEEPTPQLRVGKDLGPCCALDSLFSQRREAAPLVRRPGSGGGGEAPTSRERSASMGAPLSDRALQSATKAKLEAEFRSKRYA